MTAKQHHPRNIPVCSGLAISLRKLLINHRLFRQGYSSSGLMLSGVLLGTTLLSLGGCQPAPKDTNADDGQTKQQVDKKSSQTKSEVDTQSKADIRKQTIEKLAGVPMATLISFDPQEIKQGGDTGINITTAESYSKPSSNMETSRKGNFFIGNAFFRQPWVVAPASTDARDGLGAIFNVAACQSCHIKDGRGHAPLHKNDDADSLLVRLAMPTTTEEERTKLANSEMEKIPHPIYGGQLQDRGIPQVPAEARVEVTWTDKPVKFTDGHVITLRQPTFALKHAGYGDFGDKVMLSPRIALPMIGLGLLEQIPAEQIKQQADPEDKNQDGIQGIYNWVIDPETGKKALGRFGWKAGQTRLLTQNQSAFNEDMGLTSRIRPHESCTPAQKACLKAPTGADDQGDGKPPVEISDDVAKFVEFYTRNLAVPNRRNADNPTVLAGKKIFYDIGCQNCHTPRYQLPKLDKEYTEQSEQIIYPYTDLLLHDMGEDLADRTITGNLPAKDDKVEFLANSYQWRTPALWGIGLAQEVDSQATFLHDGRARTPMEAVLWHGGEAEQQKQKVLKLNEKQRKELEAFLQSL